MNELSRSGGVYGKSYDRFVEHQDNSTLAKVQQQYWATKQAVFRKLGKKEDEHVVASDLELDTKLELFLAIQESSYSLQKIVEHYQDKILALSHEENALGRYLKEHGKLDKTRAGKMMQAVGKTMSYTSQQRLSIRVPLVRLHQEVETFRLRAIEDTLVTVNHMENLRTDYRGALLWMKDISQELDPDTYKQLEKFRKVQVHVRKTKSNFDKLKIDCLQKIDLLAASRCNMFSHALATYQNTLLQFWEKSSRTMSAIAESFKGYQHYEFNMLKELTEVGKKLVDENNSMGLRPFMDENGEIDKDRLIFFEEYHDEEESNKKKPEGETLNSLSKSDSLHNLLQSSKQSSGPQNDKVPGVIKNDAPLLDLESDFQKLNAKIDEGKKTALRNVPLDLLTNNADIDDSEKDDLTLLNEILTSQTTEFYGNTLENEYDSIFGRREMEQFVAENSDKPQPFQDFMPSQLLNMRMGAANTTKSGDTRDGSMTLSSGSPMKNAAASPGDSSRTASSKRPMSGTSKKMSAKDMSSWFNLFADLDPLENPDALGRAGGGLVDDDRNC